MQATAKVKHEAKATIRETATTVRTEDGRTLHGTTFTGPEVRAALVINGGTAIPATYYARFARHAASRGFATLTYDYRGMGPSRAGPLRHEPARMSDWGRYDMSAALDHQATAFPGLPVHVLGHSVGGQLVGLMPNHARASSYAFITVSTGVWWRMPRAYGLFTAALWYAFFPATSAIWGYVPGSKFGLGGDLPRGVAEEWARWCTSGDYFGRALAADGIPSLHAEVARPIWSLSFTDDPIANERNVRDLLAYYRGASVDHRALSPEQLGRREIGHLGFFRQANADVLWDRPLDFFDEQARPAAR